MEFEMNDDTVFAFFFFYKILTDATKCQFKT